MQKVLVSGAGIAGATAAYWLSKRGFDVTVVERATAVRSSGSPVDVKGKSAAIAEKMGISARLRAAQTGVQQAAFLDERGRVVNRVDMGSAFVDQGDFELPRADLAAILRAAVPDNVVIRNGDEITALEQDDHGVTASFKAAADARFDLVVGADGMHSGVRRLVFGPESAFVRHLGVYVATFALQGDYGREMIMYNTPGHSVVIHPARGQAIGAFLFRAPQIPDFDYRDGDQHKRVLVDEYGDCGWRVPELLDEVRRSDDLFFDSVSRVEVPEWSRGRVTLVGDAASCVPVFGGGSNLAIAGGFKLAESLENGIGDGLRRYEASHRPGTETRQRRIRWSKSVFIPATHTGIRLRNLSTRLWPLLSRAQGYGRSPA